MRSINLKYPFLKFNNFLQVWLILFLIFILVGCDTSNPVRSTSTISQATSPQETVGILAKTAPSPITNYSSQMADFDYFILALSWSPDYCAANGSNDPQQCSIGKKLGFVLHGLWPQYNRGYPSNCSDQKLPVEIQSEFAGLYPNESLFTHEWKKHGTCTGLSPTDYLRLAGQIKDSVVVPDEFHAPEKPFRVTIDELKQSFEDANAGLQAQDLEVFCSGSGRFLKELYVCFTRQGLPAACGADVHKDSAKSCQAADFLVRNTR